MIINRYLFGYVPRKIQIISLLFMIYHNNSNGLMEEVRTGEGKSLIIMFEATLKALEGKKIDILTSSPVLAERDSEMFKKFYETFGLTCDYCHEDGENNQNLNYKCYEADIVYGTVLSFAGDYLRTNFIGTKGRGYRKFDIIIIDEIDNICLDNIMNQTELLDNFKGYKLLEYIYLFIYKLSNK
jgi:preprotein translocase subunit SecA